MLGRAGPVVLQGSAYLSGAILLIGAAIAATGAVLGLTLPLLAKGLMSFDKVKGNNLRDVGIGMAGLGAGILAMGGGQVVNAFGSLLNMFKKDDPNNDPIRKLGEKIVVFQNIPIDTEKVEKNAKAFVSFARAFAISSSTAALGTVASGIADGVSSFFSKEPPFARFKTFSELEIDPERTKQNALAFKEFAEAMSSYKGTGPLGSLSQISTALGDAVYKFAQTKPPLEQFAYFAGLTIDPKKAKSNAEAFVDFANALANASPRIPAPIIFTDLFIGF
jgi:hypothetical protein